MDNQKLYRKIICAVSQSVKKMLQESVVDIPIDSAMNNCMLYKKRLRFNVFKYFGNCINTINIDHMWDATEMYNFIQSCKIIETKDIINNLVNGDRKIPKQFINAIKKLQLNNDIDDQSEIVSAINEYQKILVIYITSLDIHFFFDCNVSVNLNEDLVISQSMREKRPGLNDELVVELKNRLSKGEVKFSFRKLNDRLRRARGTVDLNTILKENPDFGEWNKEYQPLKLKNPYVIRYYDLDKKNWRSCDVSRLLIIIE